MRKANHGDETFWGVLRSIIGTGLSDFARLMLVIGLFTVIAIVGLALYLKIPLLVAAILVALAVIAFFVFAFISQ